MDLYRFYHYPICPFCRRIRFIFADKKISYIPIIENFWEKREKFCLINPTGEVPFLAVKREGIDEKNSKNFTIFGSNSILTYINDKYGDISYIYGNLDEQIEIKKMCEWFDIKFYNEAVRYILNERVYLFYKYKGQKQADLQLIKIARINLSNHIKFITKILSKKDFIASNDFSMADLTLACHISSLDYLGEIDWVENQILKDWYSLIKSKPAFREILYDILPGIKSANHYRELDF